MNASVGLAFERVDLPPDGFVLLPKTLYLAATLEIIGSTDYAITLLGRSSLGRLGLFLNITADLGHVGTLSQWTLELSVVQPLRVYSGMRIGQVAFWKAYGKTRRYCGRYHQDLGPIPSKHSFEKVESGVLS
jgi:dCTP deaminase